MSFFGKTYHAVLKVVGGPIDSAYNRYTEKKYCDGEGGLLLHSYYVRDYKKLFSSPKSLLNGHFARKLIFVHYCHTRGFSAADWTAMNISDDSYSKYLSTLQYCKMHPINREYSKWIDDKLTLKYLCYGTKLNQYLPDYYYQIDSDGKVLCLTEGNEIENGQSGFESICKLLLNKRTLAFKQISGTIGQGFYKAEFNSGHYYLNGREMTVEQFLGEVKKLRNYLITEYLFPHPYLSEFSNQSVNCIRYTAGRVDDRMIPIKCFIRFGTKQTGYVENYGAGGVLCFINQDGLFSQGNMYNFQLDKNEIINNHPDNGKRLSGTIPMWDEIEKVVRLFGSHFPQLNYLGFDFAVTDKNKIKILEINSFTTLSTLQFYNSILESVEGNFFRERLSN